MAASQNIRIRLKAFDFRVLDASTAEIVSTAKRTGASVRATRPTVLKMSWNARETPMTWSLPPESGIAGLCSPAVRLVSMICQALSTTGRSSKVTDSFLKISCAPCLTKEIGMQMCNCSQNAIDKIMQNKNPWGNFNAVALTAYGIISRH